MKLASKIMLLFLLAVVAITGLFSYLTIQQDSTDFTEDHAQKAANLVESMKPHLLDAWNEGGHEEVDHVVRISTKQVRHTIVRYFRLDDTAPGETPATLAYVRQNQSVTETITDSNGISWVHTVFPFDIDGKTRGEIDVSEPTEPVEERMRETITNSVLSVLAVAAICGAILIVGGVRMIGRPLNQLVEKTKRVGQGDFSEPLHLNRKDELGQLAMALNEMCDQLAEQRKTIQAETASRIETEHQLRHADRLKTVGRLAAGVAHEMGTPLNVVSGRAGLIAGGKLNDEEIQKSAVVIKTEADRIAKIIRELLDFARRSTPQREAADLRQVLDHAVDLLRPYADKAHVALEVEADSEAFPAHVDAGQIQQVITNLVMNAVQSMDDAGRVDVRLAATNAQPPEDVNLAAGEYYQIDVTDNGSGIPEERLHDIFEPFFTTKDVGAGTGLGLSISYGIVQEHNGWISVTSEVGQGSCFSVYLPKSAPAES
ncbi:Sporulation kinase E [Symmachiella dynata]|uniref:sensor histidine kinase n=1 Tax=Symmachiella dynata TaxID=2527995 RepID=UPI001189BDB6|nr:HAMP domain-containing sensor histidine kinase [Symmachiella dynata]QDT51588.1 Sporulation kinase E [Symmachiella dynata]